MRLLLSPCPLPHSARRRRPRHLVPVGHLRHGGRPDPDGDPARAPAVPPARGARGHANGRQRLARLAVAPPHRLARCRQLRVSLRFRWHVKAALRFAPSKPVALIILGLTPFIALLLPRHLAPDVRHFAPGFPVRRLLHHLVFRGRGVGTCSRRPRRPHESRSQEPGCHQGNGPGARPRAQGRLFRADARRRREVAPAALVAAIVLAMAGSSRAECSTPSATRSSASGRAG